MWTRTLASAFFIAALAGAQDTLLVLSKGAETLSIVDPSSYRVLASVKTGTDPHEVTATADGAWAFVSNYGPGGQGNTLSLIDLKARTGRVVDLGQHHGIHAIGALDGRPVFAAEREQVVATYDPATSMIQTLAKTGQGNTHMLVISKDGRRMFAPNMSSNSISILDRDGATWKQTLVPVGRSPEGLDLSPDGKELWTATYGDGNISVIDTATKKVSKTFSSGTQAANRLKFTPDGKYALVSDRGASHVVVIDAATHTIFKKIDVGPTPEGIQVEPSGARAFVAVSAANDIAVIDLKTWAVIRRFAVGPNPDGMAWVSARR